MTYEAFIHGKGRALLRLLADKGGEFGGSPLKSVRAHPLIVSLAARSSPNALLLFISHKPRRLFSHKPRRPHAETLIRPSLMAF